MFTHLTGQARRVLQLAHQEAFARNHDYVGTEHLLLAMLREGSGTANRILAACQISPSFLIEDLEIELRPFHRVLQIERLPLTLAVQRTLHSADEEARRMHQGQAGIEHLLLGILQEVDSQAAQVLEDEGLTLEKCRAELAHRQVTENRDHMVQPDLPAVPGSRRDPSPRELEDRITPEILPREWFPGQSTGLNFVSVQAIENQLRWTQIILGGMLGVFAMVEMFGWRGLLGGAMIGALVASLQNSLLGCVFGAMAGFFIGLQYEAYGAWVMIVSTLVGTFLGSWLGNAWRVNVLPSHSPDKMD